MKTKTRPWRHKYHDIEIPRPENHDIEIPRPKHRDIEIRGLKHHARHRETETIKPRHCYL